MVKILKKTRNKCTGCNKNFSSRSCDDNLCGICCIQRNYLCCHHGYKYRYIINNIKQEEHHCIRITKIFEKIYQTKCVSDDIINIIINYIVERRKCDNCERIFYCKPKREIICFKCAIQLCSGCAIKINNNCNNCNNYNYSCNKCYKYYKAEIKYKKLYHILTNIKT